MHIAEKIKKYTALLPSAISLIAVSKTKPVADLMEAYEVGQRIFGENKVQEMTSKWEEMPKDIEWHMIGHVQSNKVKYMAPFVNLIHAVDSLKLLKEINKQAKNNDRTIRCLIQIKIAQEDGKFGMSWNEALNILDSETFKSLENIEIAGLMGMATFTENTAQIEQEFKKLKGFFDEGKKNNPSFKELSMGMSNDYNIAIKNGCTMVRIGSDIFGARNYN